MTKRVDDLLEGINEGRLEAFEQIYIRHYGFVVNLFRRFGVPEQVVEDLTQEVFIRMYDKVINQKLNFQSETPLRAYLYRSTWNAVIDYRRKNKEDLVHLDDPDVVVGDCESPVKDNVQTREEVFAAFGSLDPADREIIEQKLIEGLSHEEIARRRGIAEGTAKNQLAVAKRRFIDFYLRQKT